MQRILYFTAGIAPTSPELAEIASLNATAAKPYEVIVMNGAAGGGGADYGAARPIPGDFAAGTVPSEFSGLTVFDPANPPVVLPVTKAVVANGGNVTVKNSAGTVTKTGVATVAANAVTGVALAATEAIVSSGATKTGVTGSGTTATITVTNGVISGIALS